MDDAELFWYSKEKFGFAEFVVPVNDQPIAIQNVTKEYVLPTRILLAMPTLAWIDHR